MLMGVRVWQQESEANGESRSCLLRLEGGDKERPATQMALSKGLELLMAAAGSGRDPFS